jgi:hypothetical protein
MPAKISRKARKEKNQKFKSVKIVKNLREKFSPPSSVASALSTVKNLHLALFSSVKLCALCG